MVPPQLRVLRLVVLRRHRPMAASVDPDPSEQLRRVRARRLDDTAPIPVYRDQPAPHRTRPAALAAAGLVGVALGLLAGAPQSPLQSVLPGRWQRLPASAGAVRPATGPSGEAGTPVPAVSTPVAPPGPGTNSTETDGSQTGVAPAGPADMRPGRHGADRTGRRRRGPLPPGRSNVGTSDLGGTRANR